MKKVLLIADFFFCPWDYFDANLIARWRYCGYELPKKIVLIFCELNCCDKVS